MRSQDQVQSKYSGKTGWSEAIHYIWIREKAVFPICETSGYKRSRWNQIERNVGGLY